MNIKIKLIFLCCNFSVIYALAQPPGHIDSIKTELENSENLSDSINQLCLLSWRIGPIDIEESQFYGALALEKAKTANDSLLLYKAYDAYAYGFRISDQKSLAIKYYNIAAEIAVRNKLWTQAAETYRSASKMEFWSNRPLAKQFALKSIRNYEKADDLERAFEVCYDLWTNNYYSTSDTLFIILDDYISKSKDDKQKIILFLYMTYSYNLIGNRKNAMVAVQKALELSEKVKDFRGIRKSYYQIALYLSEIHHNYPTALAFYLYILESKEPLPEQERSNLLLNIGDLYQKMEQDSVAYTYYKNGLDWGESIQHQHGIANAYMKLGKWHYKNRHYTEALDNYLLCYSTGCAECPQIVFHDALLDIGTVYKTNGDFKNALKYYQKSLQLAISSNHTKSKSLSYQSLADFYSSQFKTKEATEAYLNAYTEAQLSNYLEGQQYNAVRLSEIYAGNKRFNKAYSYMLVAKVLSDSISQINEIDNLAKLETHLEIKNIQAERDLEKQLSVEEIKRQKTYRISFTIGFLLVSFFGFLTFKGYKKKRKDNILLKEQKAALEAMSEKVHEADKAKLRFFTNISHELRTPLTLIISPFDRIRNKLKERGEEDVINMMDRNSSRLRSLINQLLDISSVDSNSLSLEKKTHDFNEVFLRTTSMFNSMAEDKHINFEVISEVDELFFEFDKERIEHVIANLLSNAFKYTPAEGEIRISIVKFHDHLMLTVSDSGLGIQSKDIDKIFDRFFRSNTERDESYEGTGLGLNIVKEYIELHGGTISVKSKHGYGSEFAVKIPLHKNGTSVDLQAPISLQTNEKAAQKIINKKETLVESGETILIIEDNKDLREFLKSIFQQNYRILEASNGEIGKQLAMDKIPDIIVSDIMMPVCDGYQLTEYLKSNIETCHIPIILLTAKTKQSDKLLGFKHGADDYMPKPFNEKELALKVNNILLTRKSQQQKFRRSMTANNSSEIDVSSLDEKLFINITRVVEENISNTEFSIDILCAEVGLSRRNMFRKLKVIADMNPSEFIRTIRLKRAAQLLAQKAGSISEIAYQTGFESHSYFTKCFKETYQILPSEYTNEKV